MKKMLVLFGAVWCMLALAGCMTAGTVKWERYDGRVKLVVTDETGERICVMYEDGHIEVRADTDKVLRRMLMERLQQEQNLAQVKQAWTVVKREIDAEKEKHALEVKGLQEQIAGYEAAEQNRPPQ